MNYSRYSIVMFNDAYDTIIFKGENEILKTFKKFHAKIVFGAELFCTPNETLSYQFPIPSNENKNGKFTLGYFCFEQKVKDSKKYNSKNDV